MIFMHFITFLLKLIFPRIGKTIMIVEGYVSIYLYGFTGRPLNTRGSMSAVCYYSKDCWDMNTVLLQAHSSGGIFWFCHLYQVFLLCQDISDVRLISVLSWILVQRNIWMFFFLKNEISLLKYELSKTVCCFSFCWIWSMKQLQVFDFSWQAVWEKGWTEIFPHKKEDDQS